MLAESICEKNHITVAHPPEYGTAGARTQSPSGRDKEGNNIIVTERYDITKGFIRCDHTLQTHALVSTLKGSPGAKGKKDRAVSEVPHCPERRALRCTAFSEKFTFNSRPTSPSISSSPSPLGWHDTNTIILKRQLEKKKKTFGDF